MTLLRTLSAALFVLASVMSPPTRAAEPTPVLVELFTSEGCSSCPPADQLLSDLVRTQPVNAALVIALGEHVDYWDHLGWRDPFSSKLFSQRQSTYASAHQASDEVYTPQMIVDGTRVVVGQDRRAAIDAITRSAAAPKGRVELSWVASAPLTLQVSSAAFKASAGAQVFLAITEDDLGSSVTRGENTGRRLAHVAVVRQLSDLGRADSAGAFQKTTTLKIDAAWRRSALHAIVFGQRRPLGAITAIGVTSVQLP